MKVFISHSSSDKKFVRTLKRDLHENGIETFVDEDALELGDSLMEKLEMGLKESSHFVMILSPNAINSEWVQLELKEALNLANDKLIKKIIPIKFRQCIIPAELQHIIHADLSNEVVQIEGDQLKFVTDGYSKFLLKLLTTLKSEEKQLSEKDKLTLLNNVSTVEKQFEDLIQTKHVFTGYLDETAYLYYRDKVNEANNSLAKQHIHPIVLPSIYKSAFAGIKVGDIITFSRKGFGTFEGHLSAFRTRDFIIALPTFIKDKLGIDYEKTYHIVANPKERSFSFL